MAAAKISHFISSVLRLVQSVNLCTLVLCALPCSVLRMFFIPMIICSLPSRL
jgi:hypothetical protein